MRILKKKRSISSLIHSLLKQRSIFFFFENYDANVVAHISVLNLSTEMGSGTDVLNENFHISFLTCLKTALLYVP